MNEFFISYGGVPSFFIVSLSVAFASLFLFQFLGNRTRFLSKTGNRPRRSRFVFLLIIGFSFLGTAVGMTGGWSRVGVVGDVVPAALTLLGGYTVYLFGKNSGKAVMAVIAMTCFTLTFFVGYTVGAQLRVSPEAKEKYLDFCFKAFADEELMQNDKSFCRFVSGPGKYCVSSAIVLVTKFHPLAKTADAEDQKYKEIVGTYQQNVDRLCK